MTAFPDGFRWGTATSSHQIEGGNTNNDWWAWEHDPASPCAQPSGDACDSWNRWADDVALVADLGFDNYRFSLEWSRIEPEPGEWSHAAVDHYRRIAEALLARGIDPVVTLHHFANPRWIAERGAWTADDTPKRFAEFAHRVTSELAPVLRRVCTVNEPNVVALFGYQLGLFPPGVRDGDERRRVTDAFVLAHRSAVDAVRAGAPGVPVGLALAMTEWTAVDGGEAELDRQRYLMEDVFLDATTGDDFVGIQTYTRLRVGPGGLLPTERGAEVVAHLGYEVRPQALEATIRRAWQVTGGEIPVLVTENGLTTTDDPARIAFVRTALEGVLRCLADGIDVKGYTYWSLLDNFEWMWGYASQFGLAGVDSTTFVRTVKPSGRWLGEVARRNALSAD